MSKIYCKCGNIVSLDRRTVRLKNSLRKDIECPVCRNFRISGEIDHLNDLFSGILDEEMTA
ncbi:MAG: hypothetical protein LBI08_02370 [Methanomassiliicoccaceae archaeon]|nr:hypothetical protein [Methanomassiliicoccaceae archaeon]